MFDCYYYYLITWFNEVFYKNKTIRKLFLDLDNIRKNKFCLYSNIYLKHNFRIYQTGFG